MTEAVVEGRGRTVETAVDEIGEILIGKDPARITIIGKPWLLR